MTTLSENYISTTKAFATQDSSFKLGEGIDQGMIPENIPNQLLFCSSASDTDSYFYRMYSEWSKRMFIGDPDYFVASLDCEVIIGATFNGVYLEKPLLSQSKVDDEMRANPTKALREYYNKFDNDGGDNCPIKRSTIMTNSEARRPLICNDDNSKRKIALAFDPALDYDNSCVSVGEYVYDNKTGWNLVIQNCVTFKDLGAKKKKRNLPIDEQVKEIKEMFLAYNGKGYADYENIEVFLIDIGSGGGGNRLPYDFIEDWIDKQGITHRGLIDKELYPELASKYPNAVNKLIGVSPKKYRTEMFNDFINYLNLGLIHFTEEYDRKGYINIPEVNDKEDIEVVDETTGEKSKVKGIKYKKVTLSWEEELALANIDLAKEELIATRSFVNGGVITRYDLSPEKKNKIHDDRALVV